VFVWGLLWVVGIVLIRHFQLGFTWPDLLWFVVFPIAYGYFETRIDAKRLAEQRKTGLGMTGMAPVNQSSPEIKE
jgi:hypothetical protein